MPSKCPLVVFDLDHTLLTVNSSFRFGAFLYQWGQFSTWTLFKLLRDYARYKWFGMPIHALHRKSFDFLFIGRSCADISQYVEQFCHESLDKIVNHPILQRLKIAQEKNEEVVILSSAPDFLVKAIASRLNVSHWKGTEYLSDAAGTFVSIGIVLEGKEKADYLSDLISQRELSRSQVTVYSDSYLDLPMLKLAGKAISVKPDKLLKQVSRENDWEVL